MSRVALISALGALALPPALAGNAEGADGLPGVERLLALEFGRLLDVQVSLATRTDRRAFESASAVYVLDRQAILRSGYLRLVDVLRLLPGVHVGRGNANQFGVSIRNGMNRFASTSLVMVDGRHVYTPLFGGVRWETQELSLDSIERIELVRGPGGPLWGANAVDGIVHVITRAAKSSESPRLSVAAGGGELLADASLAWSGLVPAAGSWRMDLRALKVDEGEFLPTARSTHRGALAAGAPAADGGDGWVMRGRLDGEQGAAAWTAHLGFSAYRFSETRALLSGPRPNSVDHQQQFATLDWRQDLGRGDSLRLRLTADQAQVADDILDETQTQFDIDLQADGQRGAHRVTFGLGWRSYRSVALLPAGRPCVACFGLHPAVRSMQTLSAFVQDQWSPTPAWTATAGIRLEAESEGQSNVQPTLRLSWQPAGSTTLWAALTRPVRAPTRADRDTAFFNVPPAQLAFFGCREVIGNACLAGKPDAEAWRVEVAELGWRQRLGERADLDTTLFSSSTDYRQGLAATGDATAQRVQGLELVARWRVTQAWQVEWQSAWHRGREQVQAGPDRPVLLLPRQTHRLRAGGSFGPWQIDLLVQRVGDVTRRASGLLPAITLPDRTQARVRLAWQSRAYGEFSALAGGLGTDDAGEYLEGTKVNTTPRPVWALAWKSGF